MSFERDSLLGLTDRHGPVIRVVLADVQGSTPRETGASMTVWANGQTGTIGGGRLEFDAASEARAMLTNGPDRALRRQALGPSLGQCCGGAVTVLFERFGAETLPKTYPYARPVFARPVTGDTTMPAAVARVVDGGLDDPRLIQGWFVEPLTTSNRDIWIYGAGHVGRALVDALHPLPGIALTWVDTGPDRFPDTPKARILPAAILTDAIPLAPDHAEHIILTYSHEMDLQICHHLLSRRFAFTGLIGSATKWARFRKRLAQLGHASAQISRITCPIGDPSLGKHPHAIALGVATSLLKGVEGIKIEPLRQMAGRIPGGN